MPLQGLPLVKRIVRTLHEKKAEDIMVLDMRPVTAIADYFIICTGNSGVHLRAMGDAVELQIKHAGRDSGTLPLGVEGRSSETWMLYDYVDVVVHLFSHEARDYYALERLWNDAKAVKVSTLLATPKKAPAKKGATKRANKKSAKKTVKKGAGEKSGS